MISGASEEELDIANDRADLLLEIDRLNNIISEVNRVLESILFELDQTGEAEQVIEKIEYCVKELKEKE